MIKIAMWKTNTLLYTRVYCKLIELRIQITELTGECSRCAHAPLRDQTPGGFSFEGHEHSGGVFPPGAWQHWACGMQTPPILWGWGISIAIQISREKNQTTCLILFYIYRFLFFFNWKALLLQQRVFVGGPHPLTQPTNMATCLEEPTVLQMQTYSYIYIWTRVFCFQHLKWYWVGS